MEPRETTYGDSASSWIKRIVVAADGSPASNQGLEQVADVARRLGSKVTVVYVRHLPAAAALDTGIAEPSMLQALDEEETEVKQGALRILGGAGVAWEFVVRSGSPGEEIVQFADESDADLVVVGSNRHSSLRSLLLGSTAAYLATHTKAPVLVVRSRAAASTVPAATAEAVR
jgi:nucleotide-binding universal stress UspA family protein